MEAFNGQLTTAIATLSPADKAQITAAISFLRFCTAANIKETEPAKFASWGDSDIIANSMVCPWHERGGDLRGLFSLHLIRREDASRSARRTRFAEQEAKLHTSLGASA